MKATKSSKREAFPTRQKIRESEQMLCKASEKLDEIRDHFNMEWGDNSHCDLDLALTYALRRIQEAQSELLDLLRLRRLGLNFRSGRTRI
ncbi:MAG TPA: hypothetical protein PK867_21445 [Pirellulales bacterium]|nr:hypothetical protein [Pirellulales bacterium]